MSKIFKYTIFFIIFAEALSFLSFQFPVIAPYVFGVVALVALVATIKNLEWGVSIVFAELVIGSFGKILVLSLDGFQLPIRMVIWGIVMAVWLVHAIKTRRVEFFHSQLFKPYLILAAVLGWGIIWGLLRGNNLGAIFFDVNNYLYFALVFPVYEIMSSGGNAINRVRTIIAAAIAWLSVKTILLFYIFSHELFGLQDVLYAWSRKMQLAEITNIDPNAIISRIFIQSQIWLVFAFFCLVGIIYKIARAAVVNKRQRIVWSSVHGTRENNIVIILAILSLTAIMASFSRSFWLAVVLAGGVMLLTIMIFLREKFENYMKFAALSIGVMITSFFLINGVAKFPFPPGMSSSDFLKNRASQFKEAAANSRVAQIRPLLTGIANHPAIGSGFGTSVTYQSQDPRVLKNHPDGWYTTTAFELGWLEMWLKIGLLGVGAYLYLLWKIFKAGWNKIKTLPGDNVEKYLILGGLMGLVAIAITHGLSPYFNHPLGIGIVILITGLVDLKQNTR